MSIYNLGSLPGLKPHPASQVIELSKNGRNRGARRAAALLAEVAAGRAVVDPDSRGTMIFWPGACSSARIDPIQGIVEVSLPDHLGRTRTFSCKVDKRTAEESVSWLRSHASRRGGT